MNLSRRDVLKLAGLSAASLYTRSSPLLAQPTATTTAPRPRPNIIVMLVDDMGYSDLSCFGSEIPTPHLDRFASNGMGLTYMHNAARCCPTRASLLTGLYPTQTGIGTFVHVARKDRSEHGPGYSGLYNRPFVTLPETLRQAG